MECNRVFNVFFVNSFSFSFVVSLFLPFASTSLHRFVWLGYKCVRFVLNFLLSAGLSVYINIYFANTNTLIYRISSFICINISCIYICVVYRTCIFRLIVVVSCALEGIRVVSFIFCCFFFSLLQSIWGLRLSAVLLFVFKHHALKTGSSLFTMRMY